MFTQLIRKSKPSLQLEGTRTAVFQPVVAIDYVSGSQQVFSQIIFGLPKIYLFTTMSVFNVLRTTHSEDSYETNAKKNTQLSIGSNFRCEESAKVVGFGRKVLSRTKRATAQRSIPAEIPQNSVKPQTETSKYNP